MMNWLKSLFRKLFARRNTVANRHHLMGMYFDESNAGGRRKANRDRA